MRLIDIEHTLYDMFGFDTGPDPRTVTRFRRFINQSYHSIMGQRGMSKLRRSVLTCATTPGSPYMTLPQAATSLIALADRTNGHTLTEVSLEDLRATDPGLSAVSSNPDSYVILNFQAATARDLLPFTSVWVASSNPADAVITKAYIEGIRGEGFTTQVSVVMQGTTPVVIPAYADMTQVTKFSLLPTDSPYPLGALGMIYLHNIPVGTIPNESDPIVSVIDMGQTSARYTRLHLYPTPADSHVLYADVELQIRDLTNLADEPLLLEDFHYVLVAGAAELEYKRRGKLPEMGEERKRKQQGVDDMKLVLQKRTGVAVKDRMRFSQLSPWFPAGT